MFVVTITESAPTPDETDVNTYHVTVNRMKDVLTLLAENDANFTVWINVSITWLPDTDKGREAQVTNKATNKEGETHGNRPRNNPDNSGPDGKFAL